VRCACGCQFIDAVVKGDSAVSELLLYLTELALLGILVDYYSLAGGSKSSPGKLLNIAIGLGLIAFSYVRRVAWEYAIGRGVESVGLSLIAVTLSLATLAVLVLAIRRYICRCR